MKQIFQVIFLPFYLLKSEVSSHFAFSHHTKQSQTTIGRVCSKLLIFTIQCHLGVISCYYQAKALLYHVVTCIFCVHAGSRIKTVRVPPDFGWTLCGRNPFVSTAGLKSHDYKQLATKGILKICLRGLLEKAQHTTLFSFLDAVTDLFGERLQTADLEKMEKDLH